MYAVDRYNRKWYGYERQTLDGKTVTMYHFEGADTDMGDLSEDELIEMLGPIVVNEELPFE